ncbi:UNVERIFIED_CONTAM: helix-turn-helix domain-containing protein, partial [Salmonella enterica subsp. enterica serovar Weltevreden]
ANQYRSRAELHKGLWQAPESSGSRRLDNFILALRKKLPAEIKILTNYGQGYCLQIPD